MALEGIVSVSAASVMEDVIQQHGSQLYDLMALRKVEQAATRRNEAASWLRKAVGAVSARDLPESPSEDDFRLGLRSGYILCNAMNKVQPGAIARVVEISGDSAVPPEGTPLSSYQYFENIRNFLDVAQEMGLPLFEASDLEKGGNSGRVVTSILALKSYSEWKQSGGCGPWKYNGNLKPISFGKPIVRKNSEPFVNSISRASSINGKLQDFLSCDQYLNENLLSQPSEVVQPQSLKTLVQELLSDNKPEEIPTLLEYVLTKVIEELENRVTNQNLKECYSKGSTMNVILERCSSEEVSSDEVKADTMDENAAPCEEHSISNFSNEVSACKLEKQRFVIEQQNKHIQELKHDLFSTKMGMHFMQEKCYEDFHTLGKHLQSLAAAASGYHKVLEENRMLYNQVQDLKGSIRVYCRVRPFLAGQSSNISTIGDIDDRSISVITPSKYGKEGYKSFTFNKVFGPLTTQEEVFVDTQPLIRSVLDGYNVCIFAYGQTGSGKTHTMMGPKQTTPEGQGVNYRALSDLFSLSEQRRKTASYEITVQMIEIYNEQVRDLLCSDGLKKVEIYNSSQRGLNVPDATVVPVSSTSDVIELMNVGHRNRAVSATAMNDQSSRSHSCLIVHVQGKELTSGCIVRGCMNLVDLAGSERVDKSEVVGERLKEAQHINKSLSALGDVITALAQKGSHVPYRNSKLTQLLQDSLGGQAKTLMFVHISPEADAIGETISTLKFAERVSSVELGAARANKEKSDMRELREQIASLKEALAKKNGEIKLSNGVLPSPDFHRKGGLPPFGHPNRERGTTVPAVPSRLPMEDVGNIEMRNSAVKQKKPMSRLDVHDILTTSNLPRWPECNTKFDDNEASHSDWVDKGRNKAEVKGDEPAQDSQGEAIQLPDFFYHSKYDAEVGKYKPQSGSATATTDDSEDFDVATSDSSEADMMWQFNQELVKSSPAVNGNGMRIEKPRARTVKNGTPDIRTTPIHPLMSSPARKAVSRSVHTPVRGGRQFVDSNRHQSLSTKVGVRK